MNTTETTTSIGTDAALPEHLQIKLGTKATRGEKFVHTFAHWIINFVGNYALSIAITDLFMGHTRKEAAKKDFDVVTETKTKGGESYDVTYHADKDNPEIKHLHSVTMPGQPPVVKPETPQVTSYLAELAGDKTAFGRGVQKFSDSCRGFYDKMKSGVYSLSKDKMGASHKVSESISEIFSDIFTLMLGGHITASIATYVINRTDKWARRFDNMFDSLGGKKPSEEEKADREARYAYLAEQPKKGAGTVIKSRILGFLMNNAMGIVSTQLDWRRYKAGGDDLLTAQGNKVGIRGVTQMLGNKITDKFNPQSDRLRYWSELGLFEAACTFNTSLALKLLTKEKKQEEAPAVIASAPANNNISTASAPSARSDEAKAPAESAEKAEETKAAWADKKVTEREKVSERGEIKPREERMQDISAAAYV